MLGLYQEVLLTSELISREVYIILAINTCFKTRTTSTKNHTQQFKAYSRQNSPKVRNVISSYIFFVAIQSCQDLDSIV